MVPSKDPTERREGELNSSKNGGACRVAGHSSVKVMLMGGVITPGPPTVVLPLIRSLFLTHPQRSAHTWLENLRLKGAVCPAAKM